MILEFMGVVAGFAILNEIAKSHKRRHAERFAKTKQKQQESNTNQKVDFNFTVNKKTLKDLDNFLISQDKQPLCFNIETITKEQLEIVKTVAEDYITHLCFRSGE